LANHVTTLGQKCNYQVRARFRSRILLERGDSGTKGIMNQASGDEHMKKSKHRMPYSAAAEAEAGSKAIQVLTAQQSGTLDGLSVARVGHRKFRVRDVLTYEVLATAATGGDAIRAANAHRFGDAHLTQCR
jgi:hypothetical protein